MRATSSAKALAVLLLKAKALARHLIPKLNPEFNPEINPEIKSICFFSSSSQLQSCSFPRRCAFCKFICCSCPRSVFRRCPEGAYTETPAENRAQKDSKTKECILCWFCYSSQKGLQSSMVSLMSKFTHSGQRRRPHRALRPRLRRTDLGISNKLN